MRFAYRNRIVGACSVFNGLYPPEQGISEAAQARIAHAQVRAHAEGISISEALARDCSEHLQGQLLVTLFIFLAIVATCYSVAVASPAWLSFGLALTPAIAWGALTFERAKLASLDL